MKVALPAFRPSPPVQAPPPPAATIRHIVPVILREILVLCNVVRLQLPEQQFIVVEVFLVDEYGIRKPPVFYD